MDNVSPEHLQMHSLVRWLFMPVAIKLSVRICLNFMEKYSLKSLELMQNVSVLTLVVQITKTII